MASACNDTAVARRPRPVRPPARVVVALLAAGAFAGCGGPADRGVSVGDASAARASFAPATDAPAEPSIRDRAEIQAVLDRAAAAFLDGDPEGVRDVLADPDSALGRRWLARVDHARGVPLASYSLRLDESLPDLATDRLRSAHPEPVQVVYVVEEHAIEGFDEAGPAAEDLFLTLVRDEARGWLIADDRDAEPLGLVSVDHLWDHGPVVATREGPVLALHHPETDVGALVGEARRALAAAADRWPLPWSERVPILVPRDEDELAELLHVTFDLSNFIAFATATSTGELGDHDLTGTRVVINPARFLDRSTATRELILIHELVHAATRPVAGPMVPSWLEEGVAQALGEQRSTTGTRLLDALATDDVRLPTDAEFTVGGRDRIFLSYQQAWGFLDHLVARFGRDQVARFYEAVGEGSEGRPGTEAWHVDRAAEEVLGAPLAALVDAWRAAG